MKPLRILFLVLLVLGLLACNPASDSTGEDAPAGEEPPALNENPDIRGTITTLNVGMGAGGDVLGSVLIEGVLEEDTSHDRAQVTITNQTEIFDARNNNQAMGFEALQVGQRVEARFTGPIAESYPVQTSAAQIVIIGDE